MQPLLIYDGRCGFCRIWVDYGKRLTGERIDYAPSQEVGGRFPQIPPKSFSEAVQLVRADGSIASGACAVFETLGLERIYESSRWVAAFSEALYRFIARRRSFFYWLTRLTFGKRIEPARFALTQWLFLRLLAAIYIVAFASLAVQMTGLLGEHGISPAHEFFERVGTNLGWMRWWAAPSLFWWNSTDLVLAGAAWAGVALGAVLLAGYLERLALVLLYVLYLSFSLAGQEFLSFQWDALLLETGFLAIFFGHTRTTQKTIAWLYRWLAFRLYFLSGLVKLASGDPTWRSLSALDFHYWTQPLPTIVAWYTDKLPRWFQHTSTFLVLAVELGAPFLIFMPRRIRLFGAGLLLGLEALIFLTGNYTFFNLLAVAITLFLFDDQALRGIVWTPRRVREWLMSEPARTGRAGRLAAAVLTLLILPLGLVRILENMTPQVPEPLQALARYTSPFQVVNSYGLFAVMTTERIEIVVEGSEDGEQWRAYEFPYKPGDVSRAPRWAAPYQPRLDWQMWFAALSDYRTNPWFVAFVERLLEGSPEVAALLGKNPFPDHPPRFVRAVTYDYRFSTWEEHRETGAWWHREPRGQYLPPVGLRTTASK
ncbi:MAG: lipase maturation factor family protein [Acidobacteriia bacterium]|nr:lipase maturation factor family protein [Terriglobia bacterium]